MSFKSRSLQFLFEFSPRKTIRCATQMHALETIYEYIFEQEERYYIVKDVYIFLVSVLEHHSILLTCTCFTLARACNSVKWTMSATMDVHALNVVFYKAREISQQGLVKLITCMQF